MAHPADPRGAVDLRRRLLAWYRRRRRALPWRETRDPYAIWVSEVMLQQTRAQAVEPYWRRFLERFPSLGELAAADEEEVLARWSGLGYYRRARALHAAARAVVANGGGLPREREALLALPGFGPYTAGAVLSIAFGLPEPAVDGNVERVLARLFALEGPGGSPVPAAELWSLARGLVAGARRPGEWNQALMELGATVCQPREPRCGACPLARACAARALGRERELPRRRTRPAPVDVELLVIAVERGGRILLERRPENGRMAGLWQLPTVEVPPARGAASGLFPKEFPRAPGGPRLVAGEPLGELRHAITRHRIRARLARGELRGRGVLAPPLEWFGPGAVRGLPLTGMARKALRRLGAGGR